MASRRHPHHGVGDRWEKEIFILHIDQHCLFTYHYPVSEAATLTSTKSTRPCHTIDTLCLCSSRLIQSWTKLYFYCVQGVPSTHSALLLQEAMAFGITYEAKGRILAQGEDIDKMILAYPDCAAAKVVPLMRLAGNKEVRVALHELTSPPL